MKRIVSWFVVLTGIAMFIPASYAQESGNEKSKEALAKELLQSMDLTKELQLIFDKESSSASPQVQRELKQLVPRATNSKTLIEFCISNFSIEEMKALTAHYKSDVGQKMTSKTRELDKSLKKLKETFGDDLPSAAVRVMYREHFTEDEVAELAQFYRTPASMKMDEKRGDMLVLAWKSLISELLADTANDSKPQTSTSMQFAPPLKSASRN